MKSYAINYQTDAPSSPRASKISKFGFGMTLFLNQRCDESYFFFTQEKKKGLKIQKLQNFKCNISTRVFLTILTPVRNPFRQDIHIISFFLC